MTGPPESPRDAYRRTMGRFATGVAVVTAVHEGRRYGCTTSSLTSVSLDPILLLVCFKRDSDTRSAVRRSGRFAVNILSFARGRELSARLAGKASDAACDKLDGLDVRGGPWGVPLLADSIAHVVCAVHRWLRGGDHDIVLGRVLYFASVDSGASDDGSDADPIVFYAGDYWRLSSIE